MQKIIFAVLFSLISAHIWSQQDTNWKKGILTDEFIYDTASFPSAHAATIAETPAGLIAAWFGGSKEGQPDVCIYASHNKAGKWTAPVKLADGIINDTLRYACWNPVLYQVPGGELLLFYKVGPKVAAWKAWMKRSTDNGITWSRPEALPDGFLGPVKNKPVLIKDELFCPSSTEGGQWRIHLEITKDNGKTWRKVMPVQDDAAINAIQPSLLVYTDGTLQLLCRSKNRSIVESWSHDGGKTWNMVQLSALPNNNSGTDAVSLKDGRQLLVYNHVKPPADARNGKGNRTPLNVAVSKDGKTWYASLVLEDSPVSQYSYPSVIQGADGMVHIVYTWRRQKIKYVKVDPAQLQQFEIKEAQWPGVTDSGVQYKAEE